MNQLSLSRMTTYLWHLTLVLTLLAPLTLVEMSYAGGRVFYDGFEDGTTNKWQQADYRNRCAVVSSAADGVAGPYAGTKMARCNWNGSLVWNDPARFESLMVNVNNYTDEVLIRIWLRLDKDMSAPTKITRIYVSAGGVYHDVYDSTGSGVCTSLKNEAQLTNLTLPTYWGGASGDNTCNTARWHKIEYYIKQSSGTLKAWHNGVQVRNDIGLSFQGVKWSTFYITSNAVNTFDATNHIYFDEVEVYSDTGTGATGSMADATINNPGTSSPAAPNSPQALTVQ